MSRRPPRQLLSLLGLLLLLTPDAAGAQENLVPNPSLEQAATGDPTRPASWTGDSWGGVSASFGYLTQGYDGARSVRVELSAASGEGDAKWLSDPFTAPSGFVRLGDAYRASVPSELLLHVLGAGGEEQWLSALTLPAAGSWTPVEATLELPDWAATVQLAHVVRQVGWLETDSYLLSESAPPADGGLADAAPPGDGGSGALVSVTFDDGWLSSYIHALPIMEELQIRASHYIVAGWVDKPGYQSDYMTSEQLQDLVWAGHELGSHSLYHQDLTQLDDADLRANIIESKQLLTDLGFNIVGFVPPGGAIDARGTSLAQENYGYLRTIEAGINVPPYDRYKLKCMMVLNSTTLAEVQSWVQQAQSQGGWLILLYHRLSRDAPADTYVTPTRFREDMTYLKQSGASVLPVGEVLKLWQPADPPPPVETGKSLAPADLGRKDSGCQLAAGPGSLLAICLVLGLWLLCRARRRRSAVRVKSNVPSE